MKPLILIVDDIEENRVIVKYALQREGYRFVEAGDGEEALLKARVHEPDLILMDAMMPVMDGFTATRALREDEQIQHIPVLMITALNDMPSKLKALEVGVNDFISKPFDKTEMLARIRSTITIHAKLLKKEEELLELNQHLEKIVDERTRALSIQERYNRAILDSETSMVCVIHDNRITDANLAFFRFFDDIVINAQQSVAYLKAHFKQCDEEHFFNDFDRDDWIMRLIEIAPLRGKVRVERKGAIYTFSIRAKNMLYHTGIDRFSYEHENRYIITLSDITEFELLKDERIKDIKMASIGKLAAGITHEINTPLSYMKGNMELMRLDIDGITDAGLRNGILETMDTINEGIGRIANIVDTVREISKQSEVKREKTNLYQTLIYALRIIFNRSKQISNIYLNDRPFTLDLPRDAELWEAEIVKQRIEQVWIILLNNALDELAKSKSFDERRIEIRLAQSADTVCVTIGDNAGGIEAAMLGRIFDPFVSTKKHQGMGIGLHIAKKIIDEHNGTIRAENRDGGAHFTICLPKNR